MRKLFILLTIAVFLSSFNPKSTLKGNWTYAGGIENGKYDGEPTEYTLKREYTDTQYQAFVLEKGLKPEKYEAGNYTLFADSCLETQTWCEQPSKLLNSTVRYGYIVRNDSLILSGILPGGVAVTEYWKRVK